MSEIRPANNRPDIPRVQQDRPVKTEQKKEEPAQKVSPAAKVEEQPSAPKVEEKAAEEPAAPAEIETIRFEIWQRYIYSK